MGQVLSCLLGLHKIWHYIWKTLHDIQEGEQNISWAGYILYILTAVNYPILLPLILSKFDTAVSK